MTRLAAVTGAGGFVGRRVAAELAARGWRLRLLARRAPPPDLGPTPVEIILGDLREPQARAALVAGADAVVHVAGLTKARSAAEFDAVNAGATGALAAAAAAGAPAARFLLVSSMAARSPELSPYAASKAAGEAAARAALPRGHLVVLRPAAVYGPGDEATAPLVASLGWPVQPLLNGPEARFCLIHVDDVAAAVAAALDAAPPGAVWELTDDRVAGWRWPELAAAAAGALGRRPRGLRVPAAAVRLAAAVGDLATALDGRPRLFGRAKARELLHADWSSDPARQPPQELWRPRIGFAHGFMDARR